MTLPASGAISFNAINSELLDSATTNANINQSSYRQLSGVTTSNSTISLSNFYNKTALLNVYLNRGQPAGTNNYLYDIVWNGSVFCAGGSSGKIFTSPDGITWTERTQLTTTAWGTYSVGCMAWNGSKFIIGASDGNYTLATSPDGITWTVQSGFNSSTGVYQPKAIVWSGSKLVIAGDFGTAYSTDGITWTKSGSTGFTFGNSPACIGWNGSVFFIGGTQGNNATSPDGATWTLRTSFGSNSNIYLVETIGSTFLLVWYFTTGAGAINAVVSTSTDGINWTSRQTAAAAARGYGSTASWSDVGVVGSTFILATTYRTGAPTGGSLIASTDLGVTWTDLPNFGNNVLLSPYTYPTYYTNYISISKGNNSRVVFGIGTQVSSTVTAFSMASTP
jgi:hypothetical protein